MINLSLLEIEKILGENKIKICNFKDFKVKDISLDSRTLKNGSGFIALKGDNFDGNNFVLAAIDKGAGFIVSTKRLYDQVNIPQFLVKDTGLFLRDLAKYLRLKSKAKFIAVTGSVGKTTTKEMIYHILSSKYDTVKNLLSENNFIGVPKTIFNLGKKHDFCVLELGSNHFGEIACLSEIVKPDVGVITSIGYSHMEFFKTLSGVYKEKISLFIDEKILAILNYDNKFLLKSSIKNKKIFFGTDSKADIYGKFENFYQQGCSFKVNNKYKLYLKNPGIFNLYNALASLAVTQTLGFDLKRACEVLEGFTFPKMRFETKIVSGIEFINDAYNANPTSFKSFLETVKQISSRGRKVGIFSDMLELGSDSIKYHKLILSKILNSGFDCVIISGDNFLKVLKTFNIGRLGSKIITVKNSEDLYDTVVNNVFSGDKVFLKASRKFSLEKITSFFTKHKE